MSSSTKRLKKKYVYCRFTYTNDNIIFFCTIHGIDIKKNKKNNNKLYCSLIYLLLLNEFKFKYIFTQKNW